MDWSQIVTLVSSIGLAIFTGGLVFATICLWHSTKRYADATDRSTEVSERLLRIERLNFVHELFRQSFPSRVEGPAGTTARYIFMGIADGDSDDTRKEKEDMLCMRLISAYGRLAKEVLEDVEVELQSDTEKACGRR